eukprot:CAMPEP_0205808460 /NCGR_PEP_ID=MMETSP0205-20121125/12412_1 /ASSEMBLY_ACC=CAM_ASM_000278 /TAXON_ID=36767 /ORGANISM="Euplotes focardii, Strain TN1" /LENGTH=71 /DNA_ID=CAMNT_0053084157 /DNA_START=711 /DNA_END=926 /DNA_ORIENTATION=+
MDVIKLYSDLKDEGDNLFFKNILEKYPEKWEMFHTNLNQILNQEGWPAKPITPIKVKKYSERKGTMGSFRD